MTPLEWFGVAVVLLIVKVWWDERRYRRRLQKDAAARAIGQRYRPDGAVRRIR